MNGTQNLDLSQQTIAETPSNRERTNYHAIATPPFTQMSNVVPTPSVTST